MTATFAAPLSGQQFELVSGPYRATIASVGATLRSLTFAGRDLVVPFDPNLVRPNFRGAALTPWPNRIADGRYVFAGLPQQLSITEPDRGHALHGLAGWLGFEVAAQSDSAVTLLATVEPQPGYPHRLALSVTFSLTAAGLSTELSAENIGDTAAPFGAGFHPYLVAGDSPLESWTLQLDAAEVMIMDPVRMLPLSVEPVEMAQTRPPAQTGEGVSLDFRAPRRLGEVRLDHPFTGLGRVGGLANAVLLDAIGSGVRLSWDSRCSWVQVFTDDQGSELPSRLGLAVEPVTCPPDAFNSGLDLAVIDPRARASAGYLISAIGA